ncbi:GNAT family N-acetyltransferase [Enterovibrio nigricans]|uniref:Acetyltransferase (GNAT) domain-containing protein n=1 Tax=Enterovibrio nigricans DSM 22720 TaxID=1121868 RepID=A0A1T4VVF3_9GAMM|nr:GNAT family N-acetyltransferase [Enterovibrio nigricans]SKA68927.1 Acetyltransferase (GNAT) domain-containing protein [Enterovibrio nigricans DSM 22720]
MVSIEKYSKAREPAADALRVHPDQIVFTASNIIELVANLSVEEHPYLIIEDQTVVGFFILDLDYSTRVDFTDSFTLGVRALLVDLRYQGRGIATKAIRLLSAYVQEYYPQFDNVQLTVNCRNKAAYDCYLKCGFEDTGTLYLGGPVGPQHVMKFQLGTH